VRYQRSAMDAITMKRERKKSESARKIDFLNKTI
jgi:hypothetical protein